MEQFSNLKPLATHDVTIRCVFFKENQENNLDKLFITIAREKIEQLKIYSGSITLSIAVTEPYAKHKLKAQLINGVTAIFNIISAKKEIKPTGEKNTLAELLKLSYEIAPASLSQSKEEKNLEEHQHIAPIRNLKSTLKELSIGKDRRKNLGILHDASKLYQPYKDHPETPAQAKIFYKKLENFSRFLMLYYPNEIHSTDSATEVPTKQQAEDLKLVSLFSLCDEIIIYCPNGFSENANRIARIVRDISFHTSHYRLALQTEEISNLFLVDHSGKSCLSDIGCDQLADFLRQVNNPIKEPIILSKTLRNYIKKQRIHTGFQQIIALNKLIFNAHLQNKEGKIKEEKKGKKQAKKNQYLKAPLVLDELKQILEHALPDIEIEKIVTEIQCHFFVSYINIALKKVNQKNLLENASSVFRKPYCDYDRFMESNKALINLAGCKNDHAKAFDKKNNLPPKRLIEEVERLKIIKEEARLYLLFLKLIDSFQMNNIDNSSSSQKKENFSSLETNIVSIFKQTCSEDTITQELTVLAKKIAYFIANLAETPTLFGTEAEKKLKSLIKFLDLLIAEEKEPHSFLISTRKIKTKWQKLKSSTSLFEQFSLLLSLSEDFTHDRLAPTIRKQAKLLLSKINDENEKIVTLLEKAHKQNNLALFNYVTKKGTVALFDRLSRNKLTIKNLIMCIYDDFINLTEVANGDHFKKALKKCVKKLVKNQQEYFIALFHSVEITTLTSQIENILDEENNFLVSTEIKQAMRHFLMALTTLKKLLTMPLPKKTKITIAVDVNDEKAVIHFFCNLVSQLTTARAPFLYQRHDERSKKDPYYRALCDAYFNATTAAEQAFYLHCLMNFHSRLKFYNNDSNEIILYTKAYASLTCVLASILNNQSPNSIKVSANEKDDLYFDDQEAELPPEDTLVFALKKAIESFDPRDTVNQISTNWLTNSGIDMPLEQLFSSGHLWNKNSPSLAIPCFRLYWVPEFNEDRQFATNSVTLDDKGNAYVTTDTTTQFCNTGDKFLLGLSHEFYFMLDKGTELKVSDDSHFYLYKTNKNKIFYSRQGDNQNQYLEVGEELSDQEFDQPEENPVACTDEKIVLALLKKIVTKPIKITKRNDRINRVIDGIILASFANTEEAIQSAQPEVMKKEHARKFFLRIIKNQVPCSWHPTTDKLSTIQLLKLTNKETSLHIFPSFSLKNKAFIVLISAGSPCAIFDDIPLLLSKKNGKNRVAVGELIASLLDKKEFLPLVRIAFQRFLFEARETGLAVFNEALIQFGNDLPPPLGAIACSCLLRELLIRGKVEGYNALFNKPTKPITPPVEIETSESSTSKQENSSNCILF